MQLPLTIALRRSRRLDILLLTVHLAALAALALADLPALFAVVFAAAVAASAWLTLRRLAGPGRICKLTLRTDGLIDLERSSGSVGAATVLAQSTATAWMAVMLLRCDGRRDALIILPDALDPGDLRALRLWLRWRADLS